MARYLRDPSRDHPLPRSFRHRGLHHGSGSTQNQAGPGPQIRRARIHGYVQLTALPRAPPSGPISFRTQKYKWKGWTQGEGAEGQWDWPFQCSSVHGVREGLCVLASLNPTGTGYWQDVWTTRIVPTSLPGHLQLILQIREQARSGEGKGGPVSLSIGDAPY